MKRRHLTYTYNARGYMISYKGRDIGGCGTVGETVQHGRLKSKNIELFREQAEVAVDNILNGRVPVFMANNMSKIDKGGREI